MIAVGWKIRFQINQKKMETCIYCHSEWNQIRLGGDMCVGMDMVWENGGFVLIWGSWSSGSWSLWIFSSSPTQFGVLLLFFPHPSFPLPGTKHNVWGPNPLSGLLSLVSVYGSHRHYNPQLGFPPLLEPWLAVTTCGKLGGFLRPGLLLLIPQPPTPISWKCGLLPFFLLVHKLWVSQAVGTSTGSVWSPNHLPSPP